MNDLFCINTSMCKKFIKIEKNAGNYFVLFPQSFRKASSLGSSTMLSYWVEGYPISKY